MGWESPEPHARIHVGPKGLCCPGKAPKSRVCVYLTAPLSYGNHLRRHCQDCLSFPHFGERGTAKILREALLLLQRLNCRPFLLRVLRNPGSGLALKLLATPIGDKPQYTCNIIMEYPQGKKKNIFIAKNRVASLRNSALLQVCDRSWKSVRGEHELYCCCHMCAKAIQKGIQV